MSAAVPKLSGTRDHFVEDNFPTDQSESGEIGSAAQAGKGDGTQEAELMR